MTERKTLDRREFSLAAALAALSGVAITISACGGGGSSPTSSSGGGTAGDGYGGTGTGTGGSSGAGDKVGVIGGNHGHSAVITSAQITAAGAVALGIQGSADHPHTVELTAAEIVSIAASSRVSKNSSSDAGHNHTVTFN